MASKKKGEGGSLPLASALFATNWRETEQPPNQNNANAYGPLLRHSDPAHVLARLKVAWRPRPPPSPRVQPTTSSSPAQQPGRSDGSVPTETVAGGPYSSSSESPLRPQAAAHDPDPEAEDDGDDDGVDGPLAGVNSSSTGGYVNLNAPSISSREATLLAGIHSPETVVVPADPEEEGEKGRENRRKRKFLPVLEGGEQQGGGAGAGGENVDLAELRKLAWSGVPNELRPMVWQLLLVSFLFFFRHSPPSPALYATFLCPP